MNRILVLLLFSSCLFSQKIHHNPIESIEFGNYIEVDIFTDLQGSNISSYTLFYKKSNQTSFFRSDLLTEDGTYFSAIIPQNFINRDDIYYYIELVTESNSFTIPNIDPKINPIRVKVMKKDNNDNIKPTGFILFLCKIKS